MFKQQLLDHFVSAGLNPDNMDKGNIDGYFTAITDPDGAYLPDVSVTALERAGDTLSRLAADDPGRSVALTRFEQPDRTYLAVSFLWENLVRVDLLFPFAPSFDGTVWVTAASASEIIRGFLHGTDQSDTVAAVEAERPEWADSGFLLLIGLPPSGDAIADSESVYDQTAAAPGGVQRAAGSVFAHHMLNRNALTDDELRALLTLLGATIEGKTVPVVTLLAVGTMNPFASGEQVILRTTTAGTVLVGANAIVGPFVKLVDAD
jgi:hypothetical protein